MQQRRSSPSRNESESRRYQRTAHRISSGSVCRHVKIAGRMACFTLCSGYQPPLAEVATPDHRLMQRLSGTARDVFVVAAISTINVEVVLGEFVRCFHRPPGNSSQTRRSTVGGGGTRKPARDPIGYGREAMRWRKWSNWRQVSARSGGQSLKKYNRFDITDHHRSDTGPSKPRVAGSNPAGRASFLKNAPIVQAGDTPAVTSRRSDRSHRTND